MKSPKLVIWVITLGAVASYGADSKDLYARSFPHKQGPFGAPEEAGDAPAAVEAKPKKHFLKKEKGAHEAPKKVNVKDVVEKVNDQKEGD